MNKDELPHVTLKGNLVSLMHEKSGREFVG